MRISQVFFERLNLRPGVEVGVVSRTQTIAALLARVLGGPGNPRIVSTEEGGREFLEGDAILVLAEFDLSDPRALNLNHECWGRRTPGSIIVCTTPTANNLRELVHRPLVRVVFWGIDHETLLKDAVDVCFLGGLFRGCLSKLDASPVHPPILRRVLLRVLTQHPPKLEDAVEALAVGEKPYLRSIQDLAEEFGCSPGYLSKSAKAMGFRLNDTIRWVTFLRGIALRSCQKEPWARIAPRLGFPDLSAWTNFVKRLVGMSPSEAEQVPFRIWETRLMGTLVFPLEHGGSLFAQVGTFERRSRD